MPGSIKEQKREMTRKELIADHLANEIIDTIYSNWKMFSCITDTTYVKVHKAICRKIIDMEVLK